MQNIPVAYTPFTTIVYGEILSRQVRKLLGRKAHEAHSNPASSAKTSIDEKEEQQTKKMAATVPGIAPSNQTWDFSCNLDVNFESEEHALIAYTALAVDKELQPDKVRRVMSVSNNKLSVHFEALEARLLRASFSAFVDVLTLATRTIQEFGQK